MNKLPPIDRLSPLISKTLGRAVLFLDFDGTLAPIVKRPELVRFSASGRRVLAGLAKQCGLKVIIISGRQLANVKKFAGVSGLTYVGNHGIEMLGNGVRFLHPKALKAKHLLRRVLLRLQRALQEYSGIWVEDKVFTLSIHYRKAQTQQVRKARLKLLKTLRDELKRGEVVLTNGKKVWEIRPSIDWNKGAAVKWLCEFYRRREGEKSLPIYIGDDVTDESAFEALRDLGVTVKVTHRPNEKSAAQFYLRSPAAVHSFLRDLRTFYEKNQKGRL